MLIDKVCTFSRAINIRHVRYLASSVQPNSKNETVVLGHSYVKDDYTNVTDKILSYIGKNVYLEKYHPLSLVRQRIVNYFYKTYINSHGNPQFSVHDNLSPVVNVEQNFNSLLIPENHPSRQKTDCYYLNREYLLRAHTTAHQAELIRSGLNNFLIVGDVYRRDEIDRTHFPVFHQMDAVRLRTKQQLFVKDDSLMIFEEGNNTCGAGKEKKQACHTLEAVKVMEHELKSTLVGLAQDLFGKDVKCRWVEVYFPFTEPSWELEIYHNDSWLELLGCGIMQQSILSNAGVNDRIGWAFGIGLERIAMCLYQIPDIRLFWSRDSGFLHQFKVDDLNQQITYKPISQYPQCLNDISFWLPEDKVFHSNDFYDLVRSVGGDIIEQVVHVDEFKHPKTGKTSHCYRIIYRHTEKTLTQNEVNIVHNNIGNAAREYLGVTIR